jgi:adenylate cyclase
VHSEQLRPDDFKRLVTYWREVVEATPQLTSIFIGLEENGESTGVSRLQGKLSVWESHLDRKTDNYSVDEYWAEDYPNKPYSRDIKGPDIRTRPWYIDAKTATHPTWTDTFVFLGFEGLEKSVLGVTYATPLYSPDGSLVGVLDADFDLENLCRFFRSLKVGQTGFAFVLELRDDESHRVIAHPQTELLSQKSETPGGASQLLPLEEFADARVQKFVANVGKLSETMPIGTVTFRHGGVGYLGKYQRLAGTRSPDWIICTVLPEGDILARVHRNNLIALAVGILASLAAMAVSIYVSSQVSGPLERLVIETERIGRMQVEPQPVIHSAVIEVDRLAVAMEDMKMGLRSFQKYVPADVVRSLIENRREAALGGARRTVTTLFCDIVNFTSHAESMSPEQLVERLRDYFDALSTTVAATGGVVDKYIGDAVMAFWGAPTELADHAAMACRAALAIEPKLEAWRATLPADQAPFFCRTGINTGEVVAGNIGSHARLNYTVIGDAVNLASRLEGLNKHYGTRIIIAEPTFKAAESQIIARPLDWVAVKGKSEPVLIYELLAMRDGQRVEEFAWAARYVDALELYRKQQWDAAIEELDALLSQKPDDAPALMLRGRCRAYRETPPPAEWDGVWRLTEK